MPEISVIISTYNDLPKLKLCLAAYKNQSISDFEVIVASDGCSDGTVEFVRENKNKYPYKLSGVWHKDEGYRLARIRNAAWRIAESNRVLFTDHDLVPNADCLANYTRFQNEEIALAGYIGYIDEAIHRIFTEETISLIDRFEPFETETEKRDLLRYNSWVLWGGNMSVTKKIFDETNGFDEEFVAWGGEDTDLGVRCERMKYPIRTLPEAKVFHLNHEKKNSANPAGSELFYKKKRYERTIKRNQNVSYDDIVTV